MRRKPPGLLLLVRALDQIGGTSLSVVLGMMFFLVVLQLFQDGWVWLLTTWFGSQSRVYALGAALFPVAIIGATIYVNRYYRPRPRMVPRNGLSAHTLILFLSPPFNREQDEDDNAWKARCCEVCAELERKLGDGADVAEVLRKSTARWRMPLEAIRAHAGTLRRVVVVASKETREWIPQFEKCVRALVGRKVEVVDAAVFIGRAAVELDVQRDLPGILELVDGVCARLERLGEPMDEVVIDVTGGTKLCSLAGLAATQPFRDRCIQYVFTDQEQRALVRIWDVTFELDQRRA